MVVALRQSELSCPRLDAVKQRPNVPEVTPHVLFKLERDVVARRPPGLRQEVEAIGAALVGKHEDQIILLKRKRGGGSSGRCRM